MLNPKSKDWHRLEDRRQDLRARLLRGMLTDRETDELQRVTAVLNQAFDAAFPGIRERPEPWLEVEPEPTAPSGA